MLSIQWTEDTVELVEGEQTVLSIPATQEGLVTLCYVADLLDLAAQALDAELHPERTEPADIAGWLAA